MGRAVVLLVITFQLVACTAFGPPAVYLTRSDVAQRAFVDRNDADLARVLGRFEGLSISGPDVGMQTQAQRLQLEWTIRPAQTAGAPPFAVSIAISGRPEINTARTGIDLADARIERIRVPAIPFVDLGEVTPKDESLGRLPLLALRQQELNRDGVIYEPTGVTVGAFGMRVDLAAK
jgi:hypothetical protein